MPRLACDQCSRWVWSSESRDQHVGAKPGAEAGAWLKCEDCDRQFQGEYALWQRQQSKHDKHGKDQPELKGAAEKEQQNNEQDVASKSLYTYETSCVDDSEVEREEQRTEAEERVWRQLDEQGSDGPADG